MERKMCAKSDTAARQGRYGWVWIWAALIIFVALEMARLS